VPEVIETIEQEPGAEALLLADERAAVRKTTPDDGLAVRLGMHGDDARRRIPTPEPLLVDRVRDSMRAGHVAT
jgi:hypothetical protein